MLPSLQFKNSSWNFQRFGNAAWLLQPVDNDDMLRKIHQLTKCLEQLNSEEIEDVVAAYDTVAIFLKNTSISLTDILEKIEENEQLEISSSTTLHCIKVCYELGLDWKEVTSHIGFSKEEIIKIHLKQKYTVAMMGFLPGFVFLDGLDSQISVPRKKNPRTSIPAGAVGIGGAQTGFYSLESPGGWQIIGRTPEQYFDVYKEPPTNIEAGDTILFERISEDEFHLLVRKWDN